MSCRLQHILVTAFVVLSLMVQPVSAAVSSCADCCSSRSESVDSEPEKASCCGHQKAACCGTKTIACCDARRQAPSENCRCHSFDETLPVVPPVEVRDVADLLDSLLPLNPVFRELTLQIQTRLRFEETLAARVAPPSTQSLLCVWRT